MSRAPIALHAVLALLFFAFGPGVDQVSKATESDSWDVTKPRGRTRKIGVDPQIFRSDDRPVDYWDRVR